MTNEIPVTIRFPKSLHAAVKREADRMGLSISDYIKWCFETYENLSNDDKRRVLPK